MPLRDGQVNITGTVDAEVAAEIREIANERGESMAKMVGRMLGAVVTADGGGVRRVRSNGRELFVNLPAAWCRANGVGKGDGVRVEVDGVALIVEKREKQKKQKK